METPPNTPRHDEATLEDSGEFSNFFNDVAAVWDRFGNVIVGTVAVAAIVFAGYNLITKRAMAAKQNAWIDLYGSSSVESLQLVVDTTKNPAVTTVANLRAGDLLIAQSRTADAEDAQAILGEASDYYRAALEDAPHTLYKLNALDGLAVVAESRFEIDTARSRYEEIISLSGDQFPYWVSVAERRMALLPDISEPVVFAPEPTAEVSETSGASDPLQDILDATPSLPDLSDSPEAEAPVTAE